MLKLPTNSSFHDLFHKLTTDSGFVVIQRKTKLTTPSEQRKIIRTEENHQNRGKSSEQRKIVRTEEHHQNRGKSSEQRNIIRTEENRQNRGKSSEQRKIVETEVKSIPSSKRVTYLLTKFSGFCTLRKSQCYKLLPSVDCRSILDR